MLNGTKEDVEMLKTRMEERRLRAKLEKVMRVRVCPSARCKLPWPQQVPPGYTAGRVSHGGLASRNRSRPCIGLITRQVGALWLKA